MNKVLAQRATRPAAAEHRLVAVEPFLADLADPGFNPQQHRLPGPGSFSNTHASEYSEATRREARGDGKREAYGGGMGVAKAALHCAHRTSTIMLLLPSSLVRSSRAAPMVGSTAPIERAPPLISASINLGARSGSEEPTMGVAPPLFDTSQDRLLPSARISAYPLQAEPP